MFISCPLTKIQSASAEVTRARVAKLCHALSDPTRLHLVELLADGEHCVCDLMAAVDAGQSRLSSHLKTLKEAGIVADRRDGRWVHYPLRPEALQEMADALHLVGAPKGVMSTNFGILNTTAASAEIQRLTEKDRLSLSVPLSHMFGCVCITLAAIIKGATIILPSETFVPEKILEAIEKERCTAVYGSPTAFISLMEHPKYAPSNIHSLRTGILGGAQCPLEVMKRVVGEMGVREIILGYGLTESSSWITETRPDDLLELRVSTVGRPLPNVEVKIMDPKSGEEVPTGIAGELCARGLNMKGYYKPVSGRLNRIVVDGLNGLG